MRFFLKVLILISLIASVSMTFAANGKLAKCVSPISQDDVIAVDHDENGAAIEFKRNADDINRVISRLKEQNKADPSLTKSKTWRKEMLTPAYWFYTVCGGTKDCGSKQCDNHKPCTYKGGRMSGCSCS